MCEDLDLVGLKERKKGRKWKTEFQPCVVVLTPTNFSHNLDKTCRPDKTGARLLGLSVTVIRTSAAAHHSISRAQGTGSRPRQWVNGVSSLLAVGLVAHATANNYGGSVDDSQ